MKRISISYLIFYLIIGCLLFAIGKQVVTKIVLTQCYRVIIATTTSVSGGYRTGNTLSYSYNVAGKQYKGGYGVGNGSLTEQAVRNMAGRHYYVQFSCDYPSSSKLLYGREVPGSVVTIPFNGWDRIPQ